MDFDLFLRTALPPLGYNWRKHRRKGVRRKVLSRVGSLGLDDLSHYLERLSRDPAELAVFKGLLTVTISRFYRDPPVFDRVRDTLLPQVLNARGRAGIWSAGSASGEEPYTLAIIADAYFPDIGIEITATDIDEECLERAGAGRYGEGSLRLLPAGLKERYFTKTRGGYIIREDIKRRVRFMRHDILTGQPVMRVDIVLCRNLAYTYFGLPLQLDVTRRLHEALNPGGCLILGRTESLPPGAEGLFTPIYPEEKIYRRSGRIYL